MQKLGALTPKILETSQPTSGTTTEARATPSKTLARHGGPGLPTTSGSRKTDLLDLKALLPPEIKYSLKPEFSGEIITAYKLEGAHGPRAIQDAAKTIRKSLMPMSGNECLDLLAEMKALTRPAPGTTDDLTVMMKAYLKRLMDYPADVVRHVLKTQPNNNPWWPSWQELSERLEIHTYRRRMMLEALEIP